MNLIPASLLGAVVVSSDTTGLLVNVLILAVILLVIFALIITIDLHYWRSFFISRSRSRLVSFLAIDSRLS